LSAFEEISRGIARAGVLLPHGGKHGSSLAPVLRKFRRGTTLVFIGLRLITPAKKSLLVKAFRLFHRISAVLCYRRHQKRLVVEAGDEFGDDMTLPAVERILT